jgi:hypothetical protein
MTIDDHLPARLPLVVELGEAELTRIAIEQSKWIDAELAKSIQQAGIIIVPWERFRGVEAPLFPVGTSELFHSLIETVPSGVGVELAATDEHYSEVALHADLVVLPTLLVSAVVVPVVVNLISEWLKKRLLERAKEADVKFEMIVEESDGRTKSLRYEGPVNSFESLVHAQLRQADSLVPESETNTPDVVADPDVNTIDTTAEDDG